MEPMHVFQRNFVFFSFLRIFFLLLKTVDQLVGIVKQPGTTCIYYFPTLFAYFSFNTDVILIQLDRFPAVYWNVKYNSQTNCICCYMGVIMLNSI